MTDITRNKWQVRGFAIVIFVLGFTAGMLALSGYPGSAVCRPADRFEQMATRLQLNAGSENQSATNLW